MKKNHIAVRLAWSLCAAALMLVALALFLAFLSRTTAPPEGFETWQEQVIQALGFALGPSILGGLIASSRPENSYGWLWCCYGLAVALVVFAGSYAAYAMANPETLPAPRTVAWVGDLAWTLWMALVPLLLLLFPDGRLPSPRWRIVGWLVLAGGMVHLTFGAFQPRIGIVPIKNPFGVGGRVGETILWIAEVGVMVVFAAVLLSVISLLFRYRRAGGTQRQQIKWFTYAAVVLGGVYVPSGFLGFELPSAWHELYISVAFSGLYVAIGIAILRYRLWDIDLVINRTLVYGALTACIIGLYALVVGGLGATLEARGNPLVSLLAAGLIAVLFMPLHERLQRTVNRLMYGERDDPYRVLSRLGQRLETTLEPRAVLPVIAETVAHAFKLPHVAIELKQGDGYETAAERGRPVGEPLRLPLVYGSETIGRIVLSPRAPGESFGPSDRRLVDDLTRQAGIAAQAVRLTNDLQRSRERLVTAREEERRRIRRDLHDGLGPTLSSAMLKLGAARRQLPTDSPADDLIVEVRNDMRATIADVRRLVYGLRPPALDQLGLARAIRDYGEQCSNPGKTDGEAGLRVTVEAPEDLPPLPAAVEVAAYRIAVEALNNVVRHAQARFCRVRLVLEDASGRSALRMEIADDGVGMSFERNAGVGLSSMWERAEELGGKCIVESPPGEGSRVVTHLPVEKE